MNEQERKFVRSAKKLLDESVADMDSRTLSRLAGARNAALRGRTEKAAFWRPLPLAAMAVSVSALILFISFSPSRQESGEMLVADLGLLTAEDSVEFFEDMEFYEWLSILDGQAEDISCADDLLPSPDDAAVQFRPAASDTNGAGNGNHRIPRFI